MSFNSFFGFKENFENQDSFPKGKVTPNTMPQTPNIKDKMPEGDTTDFAIEESLDIEFNIPEGDNCKNDYGNNMVNIWLNKYQQLEMLHRYVKRCDSFRDGTVKVPNFGGRYWYWWKKWYKMWRSIYFDYSAPCLIPPFIKITKEEAEIKAREENAGDGGDDCAIEKRHYYDINPHCDTYVKNYWGWMHRAKNSEWIYHYYDMMFGLKPRNSYNYFLKIWNWNTSYYNNDDLTPDGWIGIQREWLQSEGNNYRNHNQSEYNATYLLKHCPILKTLTYPNNEGKKYWKVKLKVGVKANGDPIYQVANYEGLFHKLKNWNKEENKKGKGLYIDCKKINGFNNEATTGEYFRGAYFYKPILESFSGDDCVSGGYKISKKGWELNKNALNKWNFINMDYVDDICAKTSNNLNMNKISQEITDEETGWGYSLCDFVDRAIRNDTLNCNDETTRVEFPEGQDENSLKGEKNTQQVQLNTCEVKKMECKNDNYMYTNSYSWCFDSDNNNDLLNSYNSIINSCNKNCAIGNALNNPADLEIYQKENYKYYTVTQKDNPKLQWTGEDGANEDLPNIGQIKSSGLINEYTFANHGCFIDKNHSKTNNSELMNCLNDCDDRLGTGNVCEDNECLVNGFIGSRIITNDNNYL